MLTHHDQALGVATLVVANGEDPTVRSYAREILVFQGYEIGLMTQMLDDWGYALSDRSDEAMAWMDMPVPVEQMPGLLTDEQLDQLRDARGAELDALFLDLMAEHHRGGLHMAEYAFANAGDGDVQELAARIARNQAGEINEYRALAERNGYGIDIDLRASRPTSVRRARPAATDPDVLGVAARQRPRSYEQYTISPWLSQGLPSLARVPVNPPAVLGRGVVVNVGEPVPQPWGARPRSSSTTTRWPIPPAWRPPARGVGGPAGGGGEARRRSRTLPGAARHRGGRAVAARPRVRAVARPAPLPGVGQHIRRPRRRARVVVGAQGAAARRRRGPARRDHGAPRPTWCCPTALPAWIDGGPRGASAPDGR